MMTPRVFLCEPSGLTERQRESSDRWYERLYELGFEVDRVRRDEYTLDPWQGLIPRISSADGLVALGFEQLSAPTGTWRGQTDEGSEIVVNLSSPWLQLEVGVALAAQIPVLVAPQQGIAEGVFSPNVWIGPVTGTPMESPSATALNDWARSVRARSVIDWQAGRPG
jgi:hypothetical protein